ncbi:hypothetical protein [Chryseobacterium sp. MMS23-Vi53]|uniref:hypothetical protein n=1 Tax=Chryseobacterium sp. MMS23-Vi53 TaxID=3386644 RepID=UPI0039ED90AE
MMRKNIFLLFFCLTIIMSCKSISNKKFTNEFFSNPSVIYNLKKNKLGNEINILDSEKLVVNGIKTFKNDSLNINIVNSKNDFIDYDLKQYTVNRDLAFIVLWNFGKNESFWFFFNKGESTKKWYLIQTLKKTTR